MVGVPPCGDLVDERLRDVFDGCEPAGHVAVERGIADGVLALVAGGEHDRSELVGECHEQVAADACLQVLFGDALFGAGEQVLERAAVRVERVADRQDVDPNAEASCALHGVLEAFRRRVLRRHRQQTDGLGPERVGGERGHQRRIDPARHADHGLAEPVLAHVVPEAEHQCPVDLLRSGGPRRRRSSGDEPLASVLDVLQIEERQVFFEHRGAGDDLAVGRDDHRAAVEHELVLATHRVDVHEPRIGLLRPVATDLESLRALAVVERRPVDVQDHLRMRALVSIERRVRVPGVLADRKAQLRCRQADRAGGGPRDEVPLLVEHAEVRELDLVVALLDLPVSKQTGGVVQAELRPVHEPHQHGARGSGGRPRQRVERGQVVVDEPRAEDQVLGRIAGDRELREADEISAFTGRASRPVDHARHVAVEIADGRVQLAERDADHDRKPTRPDDLLGPVLQGLLGSADVDVVRLPDEVGAFLPVTHDRADQPLQVVSGLVDRPRRVDLARLESREQLRDRLRDRRVLVLQTRDRPHHARSALLDLLVETARLLRDDHVLVERVADAHHVLRDLPAPVAHPPGSRRADPHLQLHDRVVQRLASFPRLAERRRQLPLVVHASTLRVRRDDAQSDRAALP